MRKKYVQNQQKPINDLEYKEYDVWITRKHAEIIYTKTISNNKR